MPAGTRTDAATPPKKLARRLLTAIQQPYGIAGSTRICRRASALRSIRIGRHADEHAARTTSTCCAWADHALLQAKAAGGNTLAFHVPDDDPADAERLKLEADLYEAVRNGEFSLHFQPITSSRSGGVVGVEALIRWQHPVHGLVPPSTVHSARRIDRPDQLSRQLGAEGRLHAA